MRSRKTKYTLRSSVRTLAIKVYDEQLPRGWEKTKKLIQSINASDIQCIAIRHDKDPCTDDIWCPAIEKAHYHIIVRVLGGHQKSIGSILKMVGVEYRKGKDDMLWCQHGVETVKDFASYATYLTHETEQAQLDGKHKYELDELVSNLTIDDIKLIREGYIRVTSSANKVSYSELVALDEYAYKLGYELKDFDEWYDTQSFAIRSNAKLKTIVESYHRGVHKRISEHTEIIRLCVFVKGAPNQGKSYAAEYALKFFKTLKISGGGSGKFDNLKPSTEAVIIDDDVCPNLMNVSDNYMTSVYRRNRNNPFWCGHYLVVTSNLTFEEWVEHCGITKREHIEALNSRFYICELDDSDGINKLKCLSPSMRGSSEQQIQRKKLYKEFRTKYDESLKNYSESYVKKGDLYDDLNDNFEKEKDTDVWVQAQDAPF